MTVTLWEPTIGNVVPPLPLAQGGTGLAPASNLALLASLGALGLQANIAAAGFSLVNGTQDIITWTAPNDGALHRFLVIAALDVTVAETGGQIVVNFTTPDNVASSGNQLFAGGRATGIAQSSVNAQVRAGTTVAVHQQTALTLGTALLWADIYGA